MAEEKKLEVFPIGITAKEIVKVVEDAGISGGASEITADNIDSGAATNGQVLTADGTGGCAWGDVASGSSLPIYVLEKQINYGGDVAKIQDLLDLVGNDFTTGKRYTFFFTYATAGIFESGFANFYRNAGSGNYVIEQISENGSLRIRDYNSADSYVYASTTATIIDIPAKVATANPILEGTENSLTSLQIGDTKYKISQLYVHLLSFSYAGTSSYAMRVLCPQATAFADMSELFGKMSVIIRLGDLSEYDGTTVAITNVIRNFSTSSLYLVKTEGAFNDSMNLTQIDQLTFVSDTVDGTYDEVYNNW